MGAKVNILFFLFTIISIATVVQSEDPDCVYTVYVQTGSIDKAGTDSNITLTIYDGAGYSLLIRNIVSWGGLMGPTHDYFERNDLDIFSGKGLCLTGPVCTMNLTSDNTGYLPAWYVNYVQVTTNGAYIPCSQVMFTVEQWLSTVKAPYQLSAIRNVCGSKLESEEGEDRNNKVGQRMIRASYVSSV